jgi:hypothetical protein
MQITPIPRSLQLLSYFSRRTCLVFGVPFDPEYSHCIDNPVIFF